MKLFYLIPALLLCGLTRMASASEWTAEDTAYQVVYASYHITDWMQTRQIAGSAGRYYEINPILGRSPERDKVDLYFLATLVGHSAIAYKLPPELRRGWQHFTITIARIVTQSNRQIGLTAGLHGSF